MDAKPLDEPDADVTFGTVEASDLGSEPGRSYAAGDLVTSKYRLERPLGSGGQAAVWEARNLALDSRVALKLLHDSVSDDTQVGRLLREARAVARLGHPAVVRVFDLARATNGELFIVMELLEGTSLADELFERRRFSAVEAVQLLLPIVDALGSAHAHGIVHRDVKPENIFITRSGTSIQPKLLDFGVAKLKREPEGGWKTAAGTVLGTPAYLSPEQADGHQDIDHRSDIWSLSATLYECVTGSLPFGGETDEELFGQIAKRDPESILEHAAGDAELWAIVRRGLAKTPADRWQSMQAFGEALAHWLAGHGVSRDVSDVALDAKWLRGEPSALTPTPTPRALARSAETRAVTAPARPRWAVPAAIALTAVVATLAFVMQRGSRTPEPVAQPPLLPIAPAAREPVVVPRPQVLPAPAEPTTTVSVPRVEVLSPSPAQKGAPPSPEPAASSKAPSKRDRARPAPALGGDKGLDLLSPYR
jgi:eukaryotic-like serine/threonine-protein kinase